MKEDIIEVKPGIYGVHLNLNALWRRVFNKPVSPPPTDLVVERFLRIFKDHGIPETQIPRLIPEITLEHLSSKEKLLSVLSGDVLAKAANLFQVRLRWLEGVGEVIYDTHYAYKAPGYFFEQLQTLRLGGIYHSVVAFTCVDQLNNKSQRDQYLVLVMMDRYAEIDGQDLYCYRIFDDEWNWGYEKTRIQLKAMVRVVDQKMTMPVPLYRVEKKELDAIANGFVVPHIYLKNSKRMKGVSLEDYAESYEEHRQAKETEELPYVLEYVKNNHLEDYGLPQFR